MNIKNYCLFGILCTSSAFAFTSMPTEEQLLERIRVLEENGICKYEEGLQHSPWRIQVLPGHNIPYHFFESGKTCVYDELIKYAVPLTEVQRCYLKDYLKSATYHFISLDNILRILREAENDEDKKALLAQEIAPEVLDVRIDNWLDTAVSNIATLNIADISSNWTWDEHYVLKDKSVNSFRIALKNLYKQLIRANHKLRKEVQLVLYFNSKTPITVQAGTFNYNLRSEYSDGVIRIHSNFCNEYPEVACLWLSHANRLLYLDKLGFNLKFFDKKAFHNPLVRGLLFNEIDKEPYFLESSERDIPLEAVKNGYVKQLLSNHNEHSDIPTTMSNVQVVGNTYISMMYGSAKNIIAQWGIIPIEDENSQLHIFILGSCDNELFNKYTSGNVSNDDVASCIWMGDMINWEQIMEGEFKTFPRTVMEAAKKWKNLTPSPNVLKDYSVMIGIPYNEHNKPFVNLHTPFEVKSNWNCPFIINTECEGIEPLPLIHKLSPKPKDWKSKK